MFDFLKSEVSPTQAFEQQRTAAEQFVQSLIGLKDLSERSSRFNFLCEAGGFEEQAARAQGVDGVCETLKLPPLPQNVRMSLGSATGEVWVVSQKSSLLKKGGFKRERARGFFFLLPIPGEPVGSPSAAFRVVGAVRSAYAPMPKFVSEVVPTAEALNRTTLMRFMLRGYRPYLLLPQSISA